MEFVPALRKVGVSTRNGIIYFNTAQDDTSHAASLSVRPAARNEHQAYEALVEACKLQGFDLLVRAFNRDIRLTLLIASATEHSRDVTFRRAGIGLPTRELRMTR